MLTGYILAAGFGTRLRPLTDHLPKALVPACGIPLLLRQLQWLSGQGIARIGVNAHHFPALMDEFHRSCRVPFSLFHERGSIRGTGGALHFAREFLMEADDFFVCNVDIVSSVSLSNAYERFKSLNCQVGLVAVPVDGGSIFYDPTSKEYFGARAEGNGRGGGADFIGMAFYKKEFLRLVGPDDFSIIPLWKRAAAQGGQVKIIEVDNIYWLDVGKPKALAQLHFDVMDRKHPLALPSGMIVEASNQRAYPESYTEPEIRMLGRAVWCEAPRLPPDVHLERSVVFSDGQFPPQQEIRNALVTQWGIIDIQ